MGYTPLYLFLGIAEYVGMSTIDIALYGRKLKSN